MLVLILWVVLACTQVFVPMLSAAQQVKLPSSDIDIKSFMLSVIASSCSSVMPIFFHNVIHRLNAELFCADKTVALRGVHIR